MLARRRVGRRTVSGVLLRSQGVPRLVHRPSRPVGADVEDRSLLARTRIHFSA
jgi:hypothetical protein